MLRLLHSSAVMLSKARYCDIAVIATALLSAQQCHLHLIHTYSTSHIELFKVLNALSAYAQESLPIWERVYKALKELRLQICCSHSHFFLLNIFKQVLLFSQTHTDNVRPKKKVFLVKCHMMLVVVMLIKILLCILTPVCLKTLQTATSALCVTE